MLTTSQAGAYSNEDENADQENRSNRMRTKKSRRKGFFSMQSELPHVGPCGEVHEYLGNYSKINHGREGMLACEAAKGSGGRRMSCTEYDVRERRRLVVGFARLR